MWVFCVILCYCWVGSIVFGVGVGVGVGLFGVISGRLVGVCRVFVCVGVGVLVVILVVWYLLVRWWFLLWLNSMVLVGIIIRFILVFWLK